MAKQKRERMRRNPLQKKFVEQAKAQFVKLGLTKAQAQEKSDQALEKWLEVASKRADKLITQMADQS